MRQAAELFPLSLAAAAASSARRNCSAQLQRQAINLQYNCDELTIKLRVYEIKTLNELSVLPSRRMMQIRQRE